MPSGRRSGMASGRCIPQSSSATRRSRQAVVAADCAWGRQQHLLVSRRWRGPRAAPRQQHRAKAYMWCASGQPPPRLLTRDSLCDPLASVATAPCIIQRSSTLGCHVNKFIARDEIRPLLYLNSNRRARAHTHTATYAIMAVGGCRACSFTSTELATSAESRSDGEGRRASRAATAATPSVCTSLCRRVCSRLGPSAALAATLGGSSSEPSRCLCLPRHGRDRYALVSWAGRDLSVERGNI
eukprot:COSAG01_NODE_2898_length_6893_cov_45.927878_4_plen_241_part_00